MHKGVAVVTGASRGIGRAIAIELAKNGYDIAGLATQADPENREKGLYEVKERIEKLQRKFLPLVCDISQLDQHQRVVDQILSAFGTADVLVNNAGVAPRERKDILEAAPESFDRLTNINLRGPFFFTQRIANQMIRQLNSGTDQKPSIIFITSVSAVAASPNRAEYCISKAGLSMAAMNFAVRLAEFGINVFEIRPGVIETDMTAAVKAKYDKLFAEKAFLQNRWGTPEDVGKAVAALAGGFFNYSTGSIIEVGGGFGVARL